MANLTIKNIPDELYHALKCRAELHRRSINSEVIVSLEQILQTIDSQIILKNARKLREKTKRYPVTQKKLNAAKEKGRK